MADSQEDEDNRNNQAHDTNQLLIDAIMARMTTLMDQRLENFRAEVGHSEQERSRRNSHHSATESYYSHASRTNGPRRRRPQEERPNDAFGSLKLKVPEFKGTSDPEEYLEWEKKLEILFECKNFTQEQQLKLAPTEFKDYALSWWDNLITTRRRAGDFPIDSWRQLRAIMRKRFIPNHYYRELHYKLRTLSQGSRSVEEYYKELEVLMLRADVQEDNEATMARFVGGLNREIQDRLEVQHYVEMEDLLHKAVMLEKQIKRKNYKTSFGSNKYSYQKDEKSNFQKDTKVFTKPKVELQSSKGKEVATTSKTREIQCYKCKGYGHYASSCSNKKIIFIRDNGEIESEEEKSEDESSEEHMETPSPGELLVTRRTLNLQTKPDGNEQ